MAVAGGRDLELPKYVSKPFNFLNFSIYKVLILIEQCIEIKSLALGKIKYK